MDSDTESVGSAGHRSPHSLEDALQMDLEPVGEVGPDVENGVSVVSGQDELVSLEEPVFEVPKLRDTSHRSVQVTGGWTPWMWRSCSGAALQC